jgi:hypothetical protein
MKMLISAFISFILALRRPLNVPSALPAHERVYHAGDWSPLSLSSQSERSFGTQQSDTPSISKKKDS